MASTKGREAKAGCPYCGAAVKAENLARHLKAVHPGQQGAQALARKVVIDAKKAKVGTGRSSYGGGFLASKTILALAIVAVVIAAGAAAYIYLPRPNPVDESKQSVVEICYGSEQLAYHRHVLLHLFINNVSVPIPGGVGLPPPSGSDSCFRPIHTHSADNTVHIESKTDRTYTVGDFFTIWQLDHPNQVIKFDAHSLMDHTGGTVSMQVNGVASANYENQVLVYPSTPASTDPQHIFIYYNGP